MPSRMLAGARARALASPRYPRMLLFVTLSGLFSTSFPTTILSISVNDISANLNSAPSTVTWVTTAPLLAGAVATPVLGRLGDLRGHRRLFFAGLLTAGVFSLLTAAAWNAFSLIAFRTVSQMGASAIVPSTFAILFRAFPAEQRVRASSLASATFASASVIGVIVGGPLIDTVGWRPIFIVQALVSLGALLPAAIVLRKDDLGEGDRSVDYLGAVTLAVATFALTFGINRLGVWGINPVSIGSLAFAPFAVWALILVERRARSPLLPLRVLAARNTRVVSGSSFLLGSAWMGSLIVTPLLLQTVFGLSAGLTSLVTVPRALSIVLVSPLAGWLGVRAGERRLLVGSCTALAGVMGLMAVGASTTTLWIMVAALSLSGFAFGSGQPALTSAVGHGVRSEDFGLAASLQQTSNQIGAVVGVGLFTAIAADSVVPGPYVATYLVAIALCLGAAVVCLNIADRHGEARDRESVVDEPAAQPKTAAAAP